MTYFRFISGDRVAFYFTARVLTTQIFLHFIQHIKLQPYKPTENEYTTIIIVVTELTNGTETEQVRLYN